MAEAAIDFEPIADDKIDFEPTKIEAVIERHEALLARSDACVEFIRTLLRHYCERSVDLSELDHVTKRAFTTAQSVTSETAIDRSLFRDLYLALGDELGGGAWTVRVYHKPLVNWIWLGALLMAIGGGFAVTDRRYAVAAKKSAEVRADKPSRVAPATASATSSAAE